MEQNRKSGEVMPSTEANRLNRKLDQMSRALPKSVRKFVSWLRGPSVRPFRIPVGILLIVGGIFSFLPILGIWMLPLGLVLLAEDFPFLRPPMLRFMTWLEKIWARRRHR